ncbi:TetR/AcrR family transcriptional regulator [Marinibaculum pumilum]|uniref:TetR/AcrR family transcriptional regulator n=1 Tax=Marinibaculum pumilum TaxID=1766165 RepID=A0ABV7L0F9_9PROT
MTELNEADGLPDAGARADTQVGRQMRSRILEAAEAVFAQRGFDGATTAAIARAAGLPKANLHYYFGTKEALYRAVLADILDLWLAGADGIRPDADPAAALEAYIREKVYWSRNRPNASRVFAGEVQGGARRIGDYLSGHLRDWVEGKATVMEGWMAQGRMARVDARHLIFSIWALTQHYADFAPQVTAVLGRERLDGPEFERITRHVTGLVLAGCGLRGPGSQKAVPRNAKAEIPISGEETA